MRWIKLLLAMGIISGSLFLGALPVAAVSVNDREAAEAEALQQLKQQGAQVGVYPVGITYEQNGKLVEETIVLLIKGEHTVVNALAMIDASDITVSQNQVARLTEADWIGLTGARAWRLADQQPITVSGVNSSQIKPVPGTYPLYFAAEGGVQTQVTVTVTEASESTVANAFAANQSTGYAEPYQPEENIFGTGLTSLMIFFSELFLFFLLLIPLAILVIQYFATGKIVKQIIHILTK